MNVSYCSRRPYNALGIQLSLNEGQLALSYSTATGDHPAPTPPPPIPYPGLPILHARKLGFHTGANRSH